MNTDMYKAAFAGAALGAVVPGAIVGMIGWPAMGYLWIVQIVCSFVLVAVFISMEVMQQRRDG